MTYDKALAAFYVAKRATLFLLQNGTLEKAIAESPNLHKMRYTYLHRQAIFTLAEKLGIDATPYLTHDTEKYFMYLWLEEDVTRECHRILNRHHDYDKSVAIDRETLVEMMLDWESARFSKPDKPRNAYDTLYKWMPVEMHEQMAPLLKEYNLYHPTNEPGITAEEYKKQSEAITPAMIAAEIEKLKDLTFTEEH